MGRLSDSRIVVADDHPIVTAGLQRLLAPLCAGVCTVHSIGELWKLLHGADRDLVILDLNFGGESALASLPALRARFSGVRFVVLTAHGEAFRAASMRAGAAGYVDKTMAPQVLIHLLEDVLSGSREDANHGVALDCMTLAEFPPDSVMTPRQAQVMEQLLAGATQQETADRMGVRLPTIEFHLKELRRRTGIRRMSLLLEWARNQLKG